MGMNIVIVVGLIGLVYYGWQVGIYDATITLVCSVAASLFTFMFYEYVAELFILRFFTKSEQGADAASYWIVLLLLFVVFRQLATHYFHDEKMKFNIYFYRIGGLVVGFLAARVICGVVVVGWLMFPFAYAFPPPDLETSKIFLNTDGALLHHVERLSQKVGPKDEERVFRTDKYTKFKEQAREEYERRKGGGVGGEYQPSEPGELDPAKSIKHKQEMYEEAGG